MVPPIEFAVFTVVPILVLGVTLAHVSLTVYRLRDPRPLLLVALLALMALHQATEIVQFGGGAYYRTTSPTAEALESGANLLASVASYFVLEQVTELRTKRNELQVANTALEERSAMVSVLNRVLRHNVRNDVNVIAGRTAEIAQRVTDEEVEADLATIEATALGLVGISDRTQRIMRLMEESASSPTRLQLPDRLEDPIERVRSAAPTATITLEDATGAGLVATGPSVFPEVVADVVEQIVAANDGATTVEIVVDADRSRSDDAGDGVLVELRDEGPGLPELELQAVQNAEETPLQHAEGLSLWCLKWAVDRVDGTLDIRRDDGTVEIRLPRADEH